MATKRIVNTEFWTDDKIVDYFSPEDKLFFLYLLTNPHTNLLGIYKINKKVMAFELGYSNDTISVLLDRFENKYNMIKYSNKTQEIAIRNYLKHSIIKGGKPIEDCLIKNINDVKDKSLLEYIYINIKDCSNINETLNKVINNNIYNNINNNNNSNDNDNRVSCNDTKYDTIFNEFWKHYPKKVDKKKTKEKFIKLKPNEELVELMIKQVERFKDTKEWKQEEGKYIPNPSTWINKERWEDEFETDSEREERVDKEIMEGTYGT